ncbi:ATP-binding cassette domain-containing protein, partial [Streptomyces sp. T21Q-yed]
LTALRTAALGLGGWLPIVLILAGAPWLVRGGVTAGAILGALTYVSQNLQPALRGFVQGLGGSGLWLLVTLGRILEAAGAGAAEAPGTAGRAGAAPVTGAAPETGAPAVTDTRGATPPRAADSRAGSTPLTPASLAPAPTPGKPRAATQPPPATAETPAGARPRDGRVQLHGVTFGYAPSAEPVVRDLDLSLASGTHLAVVGPSGAGKSTLAALIAGVLEPQVGQIHLGGLPVRSLDVGRLARSRVLIPQEAYVVAGTVRENLAYLLPAATPPDLDAAVHAIGATALVERLGGYDAQVNPALLSAGERQLIALVRALLPPAPLVLLDEATCHLDPAAEAVAERAFACRPSTLIVCAHRISSALRADLVLVMDGPRCRLGTHDQLLVDCALYRDLIGHWDQMATDVRR